MGPGIALFDRTSELAGWSTNAASGSNASLHSEGGALRLDYSLTGHGAFVIARRELRTALPAHYVVSLQRRGEGSPSELQLKFVDASGANVWWWRRTSTRAWPGVAAAWR